MNQELLPTRVEIEFYQILGDFHYYYYYYFHFTSYLGEDVEQKGRVERNEEK